MDKAGHFPPKKTYHKHVQLNKNLFALNSLSPLFSFWDALNLDFFFDFDVNKYFYDKKAPFLKCCILIIRKKCWIGSLEIFAPLTCKSFYLYFPFLSTSSARK